MYIYIRISLDITAIYRTTAIISCHHSGLKVTLNIDYCLLSDAFVLITLKIRK